VFAGILWNKHYTSYKVFFAVIRNNHG